MLIITVVVVVVVVVGEGRLEGKGEQEEAYYPSKMLVSTNKITLGHNPGTCNLNILHANIFSMHNAYKISKMFNEVMVS